MIEFSGVDMIAQHQTDDDGVRRALAAALGVPQERVAVVADMNDYPETAAADVVCVTSPVNGEFTLLLSVQVANLSLPYDTRAQLMQRLCELLGMECLVPDDDDVDPYFMWLVSPVNVPRKVSLDPIALDEGRYVIVP